MEIIASLQCCQNDVRNSAWHTVEVLFICANSILVLGSISVVQNYTQLHSFQLGKPTPLRSLLKLGTSYRFNVQFFRLIFLYTIFPTLHYLLHHNQQSTCSKRMTILCLNSLIDRAIFPKKQFIWSLVSTIYFLKIITYTLIRIVTKI